MVTVREVADFINEIAPYELACLWDNVGLCIGNGKSSVHKILLSLDLTNDVIEEAINCKANLILTHHPLFLKVDGKVLFDNDEQNKMIRLLQNNICFIAAHTNLDSAKTGVNYALACKLDLKQQKPFLDIHNLVGVEGRIGTIEPVSFSTFIEQVKQKLCVPHVKYVGNSSETVQKIAVMSGSGGDFIPYIEEYGLDVLVTSDVKYHQAQIAYEHGVKVIDAGHFETEVWVMDILEKQLKERFGTQVEEVEVIKTNIHKKSFWDYA